MEEGLSWWLTKICTTPARKSDLGTFLEVRNAFRVAGATITGTGACEGCKNVGRRGGFEEGLKRCFLRARRRDLALYDVDV